MSTYSSNSLQPSHDEIAARARELWLARSCPIGQDDEIWLEAERQVAAERRISRSPGVRRKSTDAGIDIDERQLSDRLSDIGDPGHRSATSVDPTH